METGCCDPAWWAWPELSLSIGTDRLKCFTELRSASRSVALNYCERLCWNMALLKQNWNQGWTLPSAAVFLKGVFLKAHGQEFWGWGISRASLCMTAPSLQAPKHHQPGENGCTGLEYDAAWFLAFQITQYLFAITSVTPSLLPSLRSAAMKTLTEIFCSFFS